MRQTQVLRMECGNTSACSSTPCVQVHATVGAVLRSRRSAHDQAAMHVEHWDTRGFAVGACLTASGMCVHAQATRRAFWSSRRCAPWQAGMWLQRYTAWGCAGRPCWRSAEHLATLQSCAAGWAMSLALR